MCDNTTAAPMLSEIPSALRKEKANGRLRLVSQARSHLAMDSLFISGKWGDFLTSCEQPMSPIPLSRPDEGTTQH